MSTYNKVTLDDTTLMDISDTTAVASDVAQGKYFYTAGGVKTAGTASGGGGASNFVTGTFTGTTTGAAMDVTLNYSGSGFPVVIEIEVSEGADDSTSTFKTVLQRYAMAWWMAIKSTHGTPTYSGSNVVNFGVGACRYKNSATTASSEASYTFSGETVLSSANATNARGSAVRIKDKTTMSVFIASDSYGFLANTQYTYRVIYSS